MQITQFICVVSKRTGRFKYSMNNLARNAGMHAHEALVAPCTVNTPVSNYYF